MIEERTIYTWEQVKQHNSLDDAWVVKDGVVYDVSNFLGEHPGGPEIVEEHLGKDISSIFFDESSHEHSDFAVDQLSTYEIGILENAKVAAKVVDKEAARLQAKVDFKHAILPQIPGLGTEYQNWLHTRPVVDKMTIFPYRVLEMFTGWPWWYIFVLWIPTAGICFYESLRNGSTLMKSSGVFCLGLFFWTFMEYVLHRFIFHYWTTSTPGNIFHYFAHGIHHLTPTDTQRLTFPPPFSIGIGKLFYVIFSYLPYEYAWQALFAGAAIGYMLYDALHYYFHHLDFKNVPLLSTLKTHHLNHHYKDENKSFGVSSPFWDIVFGTYNN